MNTHIHNTTQPRDDATHLEAREGGHDGEEARHGLLLPHGLEHLNII